MQKSNKIIAISLVSFLIIFMFSVVVIREREMITDGNVKKIELNDGEKDVPQSEIGILYDQYIDDTENKEKELDSSLKQRKDLRFINSESIYSGDLTNNNPKYPNLDCDKEEIGFAFIPDPFRKEADENVIFEDKLEITVINKENDKVIQSKEGYALLGISKIQYDNTDYYLTDEYTGGSHCCSEQRVISCQKGKVKIGDSVDFRDSGGYRDVFIKNYQIYYSRLDTRFSYFNLSFATSYGMNFLAFYKFDSNLNKFVNASKEFPEYYSELAKQQDGWLIKLRDYKPTFFDNAEELWYFPLIKRLTAGYLSGTNQEILKEQFMRDFNYFINSPLTEKNFLFPLTKDDANKVFDDTIKILSE